MSIISGACLCGAVRYRITRAPVSQGVCYCKQCQRTGAAYGGPLLVVYRSSFECALTHVSFYITKSDDGSSVKRNFCSNCGSGVFSEVLDVPEIVTVKAATLDDFDSFIPGYLAWTECAGRSCVLPPNIPAFPQDVPLNLVLGLA